MTKSPMHFRIGDAAATMRLACGAPIKDANWTQSPREVDCVACQVADVTTPWRGPTMKRSQARALLDAYAHATVRVHDLRTRPPGTPADMLEEARRDAATLRKQIEDLLAKVEVPHHASSSNR